MRRLLLIGILVSCSDDDPVLVEVTEVEDLKTDEVVETTVTPIPDVPEEPVSLPVDPYAGHETWCEELQPPPCATTEDCEPSKIGVDRRCITPFWYEPLDDEKAGLCIPVYLGWSPKQEKLEMDRRRARLLQIVKDRCHLPSWAGKLRAEYGNVDCGRVPGRSKNMRQCIEKTYCDPYKLDAALRVVVKRESDWRRCKAHNKPEDVEASKTSWLRMCARGLYEGNEHFGSCVKSSDGKKKKRWLTIGHEWKRWRTYGYFGQISSYRVLSIDKKAPPEIMCHEVYGTEAYLRAMRRAWQKYDNGVDCNDAQGRRYNRKLLKKKKQKRDGKVDTWPEKTWHTLHRAASSGALCPRDRRPNLEGVKTKRQYYEARMVKVGMDLDEEVTLEMLGNPLSSGTELHVQVQALVERLDVKHPPLPRAQDSAAGRLAVVR